MYPADTDLEVTSVDPSDAPHWYVRKFRLETQEVDLVNIAERAAAASRVRKQLWGFLGSLIGLSGLLLWACYQLIR
jgi:hypothetical protein